MAWWMQWSGTRLLYRGGVCHCLTPHLVVLRLANVEMVFSNLSWLHCGCGNIAVTVVSRTAVLVVMVVCVVLVAVLAMIAVVVME